MNPRKRYSLIQGPVRSAHLASQLGVEIELPAEDDVGGLRWEYNIPINAARSEVSSFNREPRVHRTSCMVSSERLWITNNTG